MRTELRERLGSIPPRRRVVLAAGILLLVGVTGFGFAKTGVFSGEAEDDSELQTATVRSGDLVLLASGSGTLLAESVGGGAVFTFSLPLAKE